MAQQPMPWSSSLDRDLEPGEESQVDIKEFAYNNQGRNIKELSLDIHEH